MAAPPRSGIDSAEAAARWNAERLALALAAARLGDWSWDAATDLVTVSPRAAEILGIPHGPMSWSAMREVLHPDDRERARLAVERALEDRGDYRIEYRVVADGRERWVLASGRGEYDEHGGVGLYGIVQDVTRDHFLVRVDDVLRTLVKPEDITYAAARELGQLLAVNRCAYAFVEDDQDTFILTGNYTNGVQSIVGTYRFRQFSAECLRLMRAGEPWIVDDSEADARIDADDREAYRFTAIRAVICVPILKTGRFVAAMAVHTKAPRSWSSGDVELMQQVASRCWESIERARVEGERARLLDAAEAANRAKDEFLAMLGHELRNPLAPMVTALELMKQRASGIAERERTVIERQVVHLTRLVDDLLDVSRIARGKVTLERERVEIADVLARAVEVASPLYERRRHALTLDVPPTGLAVDGDVARLVQVVSNLLSNAGKYTAPGGAITVTATADDGEVVVLVRDTGIGMTPEILPHVFDLFVQGAQTLDRAQGGLGLGLAIVRSLVERHGGRVSAHSDGAGRGSDFVIRLPRAALAERAPAAAPDRAVAPSDPTSPIRVLVVDDNVDAADMLADALAHHGCVVEVAYDGPDALRLVETMRFDLALLDIGLPVMDGYELAGRLRAHPHLDGARLVAITGYGQRSDRDRALAAGFDDHLVKPIDLTRLTAIVATCTA